MFQVNLINSFDLYKNIFLKRNSDIELLKQIVDNCDLIHGFDFMSLYEMNIFLNKFNIKNL